MRAVERQTAATWVAPSDATDRGNLLGAAVVAARREGRDLGAIVEGAGEADAAIEAARRCGLLIVPAHDRIVPDVAQAAALIQQARAERWRLLLLTLGADSAAPSGASIEQLLLRLAATELPDARSPMPPLSLRGRVGGFVDEAAFTRSGLLHVDCFASCLAQAGVTLADSSDLLEWGAGCGRMTAHLPARAPAARITAVDTDAEAMAWAAEALSLHAVAAVPQLPPTTLESDAYDIVIGHSVFSHLDLRAQDAWLEELARVTRPGGHVAVSFNGPEALDWHLRHPLVDVSPAVADAVARDGIAVWGDDGWEAEFYDGYHTTFHTHAYVREHWSRWFEVVEIHAAAALPTQDVAVLRAPAERA